MRYECSEKPTSVFNVHLLRVSSPELSTVHQWWSHDVPELDSEDWEDAWDFTFKILVSLRDCLIQFKVVYRAYLASHRLHKMRPSLSSYWTQVLSVVNEIVCVSIVPSPKMCLLGLVEVASSWDWTPSILCRDNYYLMLEEAGSAFSFPLEKAC